MPRNGDSGSPRVFMRRRARQKYGVTEHGSEIEGSKCSGRLHPPHSDRGRRIGGYERSLVVFIDGIDAAVKTGRRGPDMVMTAGKFLGGRRDERCRQRCPPSNAGDDGGCTLA